MSYPRIENEKKLPSYHCFIEKKSICPIVFCTCLDPQINIDWSLMIIHCRQNDDATCYGNDGSGLLQMAFNN